MLEGNSMIPIVRFCSSASYENKILLTNRVITFFKEYLIKEIATVLLPRKLITTKILMQLDLSNLKLNSLTV